MAQLIITAVGPDKPGLVGELTGHLAAAHANILDSRMVNLRGQFSIILLLEGPDHDLHHLRAHLPQIGHKMGLAVMVADQAAPARRVEGLPYRLKTYSMDQPGLVHRITEVLRERGVNIEELTTHQESAAFAGTPLFTMEARITVPRDVPVRTLRQALEARCAEMNCDLDMEPA